MKRSFATQDRAAPLGAAPFVFDATNKALQAQDDQLIEIHRVRVIDAKPSDQIEIQVDGVSVIGWLALDTLFEFYGRTLDYMVDSEEGQTIYCYEFVTPVVIDSDWHSRLEVLLDISGGGGSMPTILLEGWVAYDAWLLPKSASVTPPQPRPA